MLRREISLEPLLHHRYRSSGSSLGMIRLLIALPPAAEEEDYYPYNYGSPNSTSACSTDDRAATGATLWSTGRTGDR
jgi:hypothetical protein